MPATDLAIRRELRGLKKALGRFDVFSVHRSSLYGTARRTDSAPSCHQSSNRIGEIELIIQIELIIEIKDRVNKVASG